MSSDLLGERRDWSWCWGILDGTGLITSYCPVLIGYISRADPLWSGCYYGSSRLVGGSNFVFSLRLVVYMTILALLLSSDLSSSVLPFVVHIISAVLAVWFFTGSSGHYPVSRVISSDPLYLSISWLCAGSYIAWWTFPRLSPWLWCVVACYTTWFPLLDYLNLHLRWALFTLFDLNCLLVVIGIMSWRHWWVQLFSIYRKLNYLLWPPLGWGGD